MRELTLTASSTEPACADPPHSWRSRDRRDLRAPFEQERRHLRRRAGDSDVVPGILVQLGTNGARFGDGHARANARASGRR